MKRLVPIILISTISAQLTIFAQEPKALPPQAIHTNLSEKTEYILSEEDFNLVLETGIQHNIALKKIDLLQEQAATLQTRIALSDSAITIQSLEALFWHEKLLQTDAELEKERLARKKIWNSRLLWFVVGAMTATVVLDAQ